MNKVVVYFNEHTSHLDFHHFLKDFVSFLKLNFDTTVVHLPQNGKLILERIQTVVADCELLIYSEKDKGYRGISFSDCRSPLLSFFIERNSENDIIIYSQYTATELLSKSYKFKWGPGIYFPSVNGVNYDELYNKRVSLPTFIDKIFFKGNVKAMQRGSIQYLINSDYFSTGPSVEHLYYLEQAINHKVGLSIPGIGELCFRDIEYLGAGVPMLKMKYITDLNPPLLPNYHYISIERDTNFSTAMHSITEERVGGEIYCQKYIKRFLEVKDDIEFLNFISKNGREYYKKYLDTETRKNHLLTLLDL